MHRHVFDGQVSLRCATNRQLAAWLLESKREMRPPVRQRRVSRLPDKECSSQGTHVSCEVTAVESEVLVKTSSGWKIALGHTTALPKTQK